jgi:hypothetical protein
LRFTVTVKQRVSTLVLTLLLAVAGAAWWKTAPPTAKVTKPRAAAIAAAELVDQSTYATAQRLARLAETPDEQTYAQSALRVADHALAFAFTTALRDAEAHPPALSPDALKIQDRIRKSQGLLESDQQRVTELSGALAQAKAAQKDAVQDELDLAQSQLDLDKDELEEADQDLIEAGGNPQKQIETLEQEHDAQVKARTVPPAATSAPGGQNGSLRRSEPLWLNHSKRPRAEFRNSPSTRRALRPRALHRAQRRRRSRLHQAQRQRRAQRQRSECSARTKTPRRCSIRPSS